MSRNRTATDPIHPRNRSKVGNGTRLLADIDYRSPLGRRFRELVEDYTNEFETASKFDTDLIRLAAGLVMKSEEMTAATVRGENVDADAVIKMAGQLRRVLADLKRRSQSSAPPAASILDRFASQTEHDAEQDA
jgi:hypothetical protein